MPGDISAIRKDYQMHSLSETDVAADPFTQFNNWWNDAVKSEIDELNAMTLATASSAGIPSARVVLLKEVSDAGFVFFTNYKSHKAKDLEENPNASLVFYWKELERQINISGKVEKVSSTESDEYFNSRPEGSRIGAWASPQSSVIASRAVIEENITKYTGQFAGGNIPRPPHWGGYIVKPLLIEFWQGRSNRLHDRILYTRTAEGSWKQERLAP